MVSINWLQRIEVTGKKLEEGWMRDAEEEKNEGRGTEEGGKGVKNREEKKHAKPDQ